VAVGFSGGLDSSVLVACSKKRARVLACGAFVEGAPDSRRVEAAAGALGVRAATVRLTRRSAEADLVRLDLPFAPSVMDRSLWCLYSAVARLAKEEGEQVLLLGQMADELFGGYAKYAAAAGEQREDTAQAAMRRDVEEYPGKGRVRDVGACSPWVEARFPFEDASVVRFGLSLPLAFKIRGGTRKAVLRRAAVLVGVPPALAEADKKAAQYSSGIQKLLA
jgi:asparagine synthase (glutamine-hydrolysing)